MKMFNTVIDKLDAWQRRHRWSAFTYAVIKKYGEDESGYQAALLTYYGFLSLFPFLLIVTTLAGVLASNHPTQQQDIIQSVTNYFPVLGDQLSNHIHTLHKNGLALIIGVAFTLYGARGVADAFRRSVQHIWSVPRTQRPGFPHTLLNSLAIILVGGLGFVAASVSTGFAASAGHGAIFGVLALVVNVFILFWVFAFLLNTCLPRHVAIRDISSGALAAAIGLVILQALGGYLLKSELRHLDALYSYFAVALGLLFWIYLQAQLMHYAITLAAVRAQHLWPRSIHDKTEARQAK